MSVARARIVTLGLAGTILPHCYDFGPGTQVIMSWADNPEAVFLVMCVPPMNELWAT